MKKVLKYKNIIAFFLVFILVFGVVTDYKIKETKATVLIDDILFWSLGALVLSSGVIAVSDFQLPDMGQLVFDKWKSKGYDEWDLVEDVVKYGSRVIKVTNKLKSVINEVVEGLTSDRAVSTPDITSTNTKIFIPKISGRYPEVKYKNAEQYLNDMIPSKVIYSFYADGPFTIGTTTYGRYPAYVYVTGHYDAGSAYYEGYNELRFWSTDNSGKMTWYTYTEAKGVTINATGSTKFSEKKYNNVIPYTNPLVKQNYGNDVIDSNYPTATDEKPIFVPLPQAIPNLPTATGETPLTWDNVKNEVKPIEQENEIDWSGGDPEQEPDDNDTPDLWKWLTRILRWLFSPVRQIKNILGNLGTFLVDQFKILIENIKNIPNVFRDFFTNIGDKIMSLPNALSDFFSNLGNKISELPNGMVSGFRHLLKELFVPDLPPEAIFTLPPDSMFGGIVEIFNFERLFNITPKPIEFETDINYGLGESKKTWHVELKPFSLPYIKDNLNVFRNVMSYSILILVLWAIVHHLLPKREMD